MEYSQCHFLNHVYFFLKRFSMQALSKDIVLVIIITLFVLLIISFIMIFTFLYQKRHNNYIKEKQLIQTQFQQTLLQAQLEIQEQTLKNISQEIHDNIGQSLSLAKLHLGTMDATQPLALEEKILDSRQLVSKAIRDLRQLSHSLDADQIGKIGLVQALETELEVISRAGAHQTKLEVDGTPYRIDKQKELILFRIVQEALHNIIKHAEARTIGLHFRFTPVGMELRILDDGKGFTIPLHGTNENITFGVGIRNMHDRANLIGATLHISSTPETGTTVSLYLSQTIKPN